MKIISTIIWNEPLSSTLRFEDRVSEIVGRFDVTSVVAETLIAMIDGQKMHVPHRILSGFTSAEDAFDAYGVVDYTEEDLEQLEEIIAGCANANEAIEAEFLEQLNEHLDAADVRRATYDSYGDPIKWSPEITRADVARQAQEVAKTFIEIEEEKQP